MKIIAVAFICLCAHFAYSQFPPDTSAPSTWSVNKPVSAIVPVGDIVYIGGGFTKIGRYTGQWAIFNAATGATEKYFEILGEESFSVCPDHNGGWFVGNRGIWHVLPDGEVDTLWKLTVLGTRINALHAKGTTVYVGGEALKDAQSSRAYGGVVALNAVTGLIDTTWRAHTNGTVHSFSVNGGILYVAGAFDSAGNDKRFNLAAFDLATGSVLPWNPAPNPTGYVYAVAAQDKIVYAGGVFITIGGKGGPFFAALDASTGNALPFTPNPDRAVRAIAVKGNAIYAGGDFTKIGNQNRGFIACLDSATGSATSWAPSVDNVVHALALDGATLFAAGKFTSVGGQARNSVAALRAESGDVLAWNPGLDSIVNAISIDGEKVFAVGGFSFIESRKQQGLAAINMKTGRALSWNPGIKGASAAVHVIAARGDTLYAGGYFDTVGEQIRKGIAGFNLKTGALTSWNPALACSSRSAVPSVSRIVVSGTTVFIGGAFDSVGGRHQRHLAAIDAGTGKVSAWDPDLSERTNVHALATDNDRLYVGGYFDTIQGQVRHGIAAFDMPSGTLNSWNPVLKSTNSNPYYSNLGVSTIIPRGNAVYIAGGFDSVNGQYRRLIACVDSGTGNVLPWTAQYWGTSGPSAMVFMDTVLFFGSFPGSVNTYSTLTGKQLFWNFSFGWGEGAQDILAMAVDGNSLYVGGSFRRFTTHRFEKPLYQVRSYFARFGTFAPFIQNRCKITTVDTRRAVSFHGGKIEYSLDKRCPVRLSVFNVSGKRISLIEQVQEAGTHTLNAANRRLSKGLYIVRFESGSVQATRGFMIVQ